MWDHELRLGGGKSMKTVLTFFELFTEKVNRYRNSNNWLLDIIAPNQQLTTAVIANFGQVVKQGDGKDGQARGEERQSPDREVNNGDIKIHPLITRLVDPEVLKKMGAAKDVG